MRVWVLVLGLALASCASSSAVVTGSTRAAIPVEQVKVYDAAPPRYAVIAIIQAQANDGVTDQWNTNLAMAELKERAARLGANGVLIDSLGGQSSGSVMLGPSPTMAVKARAIFVPAS